MPLDIGVVLVRFFYQTDFDHCENGDSDKSNNLMPVSMCAECCDVTYAFTMPVVPNALQRNTRYSYV